jgi:hypothetical protein
LIVLQDGIFNVVLGSRPLTPSQARQANDTPSARSRIVAIVDAGLATSVPPPRRPGIPTRVAHRIRLAARRMGGELPYGA